MIKYITGDATEPVVKPCIIAHVCNDEGKWGKGFVLALSKKYPLAEEGYRAWFKNPNDFGLKPKLGHIQIVSVNKSIIVANMIAQKGIAPANGVPPIRYPELKKCLGSVHYQAHNNNLTIHMPRIGSRLAGGKWEIVEECINRTCPLMDVYVYTLPSELHLFK